MRFDSSARNQLALTSNFATSFMLIMLEFLRGAIRPTLTWMGFATVSVIAILDFWETKKVPMWYVALVGPMIGFWFGQRKPSV